MNILHVHMHQHHEFLKQKTKKDHKKDERKSETMILFNSACYTMTQHMGRDSGVIVRRMVRLKANKLHKKKRKGDNLFLSLCFSCVGAGVDHSGRVEGGLSSLVPFVDHARSSLSSRWLSFWRWNRLPLSLILLRWSREAGRAAGQDTRRGLEG